MSMSAALDVAIGLIFLYLILSLFCTTINEILASLFKWRAAKLESALKQLIDDQGLYQAFYNHGLVRDAFAASSGKADGAHPSYLSSRDVAMALIFAAGAAPTPAFSAVTASFANLGASRIRDVLNSCAAQADDGTGNGSIEKLRDLIAAWYDAAMERLSGAYKRKIQCFTLVVAAIIVAVFNADTLHVANVLWDDPTLASLITANATKLVQDNPDVAHLKFTGSPDCVEPKADTLPANTSHAGTPQANTPVASTPPASATPAAGTPSASAPPKPPKSAAQAAYELCELNAAMRALPLGWTGLPEGCAWLWKIVGLLITTMALTLGAPFWFDLLAKFVNLRGTGEKPLKVEMPVAS